MVLFKSGYSDKYYRPFPAGRRFVADPVEGKAPAWPDPHPDTMTLLGKRGVMHVGCDSPSMGPLPDLAEPTQVFMQNFRLGLLFYRRINWILFLLGLL